MPVFSGGVYVSTTFTGAVRSDIQLNMKTQLVIAGWTNVAQAAGQGPGDVFTFTVTIASPGVVTKTGHGFLGNERVVLQTTGALPTGLSVNTVYFVKFIDANTFNLSLSSGGANINTTGSQSGTHTLNAESILLESATQTNVTNPIRVRLKDNRGNCIQVSIENQAGSVAGASTTSAGGNLLPAAAKTFRITASKYRAECFTPGVSAAREFVMFGMGNVPSFLTGITDHGYMFSNSYTDISTGIGSSVQTTTNIAANNAVPNLQFIWNSNIIDLSSQLNNGTSVGVPQFSISNIAATRGARWSDDSLEACDVLVSAGTTFSTASTGDEGKLKCSLYDFMYIGTAFAINSTDTFNSHNWINLTNNLTPGGFWVATS